MVGSNAIGISLSSVQFPINQLGLLLADSIPNITIFGSKLQVLQAKIQIADASFFQLPKQNLHLKSTIVIPPGAFVKPLTPAQRAILLDELFQSGFNTKELFHSGGSVLDFLERANSGDFRQEKPRTERQWVDHIFRGMFEGVDVTAVQIGRAHV